MQSPRGQAISTQRQIFSGCHVGPINIPTLGRLLFHEWASCNASMCQAEPTLGAKTNTSKHAIGLDGPHPILRFHRATEYSFPDTRFNVVKVDPFLVKAPNNCIILQNYDEFLQSRHSHSYCLKIMTYSCHKISGVQGNYSWQQGRPLDNKKSRY